MTIDTRISLRKLEVLSAVVQLGGFGRAAESLFVAQPVVTAHIRSLEKRLGMQLFYREGRVMHLTEAGRVVHEWAEDILRRTREMDRHLTSLSDGTQGVVLLGASMSIGSYRLPALLTEFRTRYPGADLRLGISDSEHAIEDTLSGAYDFAVVVSDVAADVPGLTTELIGHDEIVLVTAPEGSPAAARIALEEFARLPFIEVPSGIVRRTFVERQLRELGVTERNVVLQLGHPEAMKRATLAGLGVTLLFRSAVDDDLREGRLREVQVDGATFTLPILIVSRKGKTFSPLHAELIAAIREGLADAP